MGRSLPIFGKEACASGPAIAPHTERRLVDSHGRSVTDLRLSITDRCNFRCTYCMEPDVRFIDAPELLTTDEMVAVAAAACAAGVRRIRVTGGEPTLYRDLSALLERLARLPIDDLAMTTNGTHCTPSNLKDWRRAGLRRLTFSLDALDPARFARMTRSPVHPGTVVRAIDDALAAGYSQVKVNAVVVRGENEPELVPLARLALDRGIEMRFIEFMPLDSARAWEPAKLVPASEIVEAVSAVLPLRLIGRDEPSSTSLTYRFEQQPASNARVGIIAPVSRPFCGACSRLRITADGKVRPCLFSTSEFDVRPLLRQSGGAPTSAIERFLIDATWTKQAGHGISAAGFVQPARTMSAIGG
ncbi:MAG: GTP 3',8-cyclase MoaA [Phycisphaerales bacterium]